MPSLLPCTLFLLALSAHCGSLHSPRLGAARHLGRWWWQHQRRPRAVTSPQPSGLLTGLGGSRVALDEASRVTGDEGESSGNGERVEVGGGDALSGSPAATTPVPGRPLRPTSPLFGGPTESGDHTPPPHHGPGNNTGRNCSDTGGYDNITRESSNSTETGRETGSEMGSERGSFWTKPLACAVLPVYTFLLLWALFNCAIFARRRAAADRLRTFAAAANAFLLVFASLRVVLTTLVLSSPELQELIATSLPPLRWGSAGLSVATAGFAALVVAVSLHELALPCLATAFAAQLLHFVPPAAAARKPCPLPPLSLSSSSSLSLISSSLPSPASGRARGALLAIVFSTHLCVAGLACLAFAMRPARAVFLLAVPRGFFVAWGLALAGVCLATAACGPVGGAGRRRTSMPTRACFSGSSVLLILACCLHCAEAVLTVLGVGAGRGVGPPLLAARFVCELCAALTLCAAPSLWLRYRLCAGSAAVASSSRQQQQEEDAAEMKNEVRKRCAKQKRGHVVASKRAEVRSDGKRSASYDSVRSVPAGEARKPGPPSPRSVADGATLGSTVRFSVGDERIRLLQGNGEDDVDNEVNGVNLTIIPGERSSCSGVSRTYSWCDAALAAAIGSEEENQSSLREFTMRSRLGEVAGGGVHYDAPGGAPPPQGFIWAAGALSWDDFIRPPSPINLQGSIDDALWRRSLIVRSLFEEEEEEENGVVQKEGEHG